MKQYTILSKIDKMKFNKGIVAEFESKNTTMKKEEIYKCKYKYNDIQAKAFHCDYLLLRYALILVNQLQTKIPSKMYRFVKKVDFHFVSNCKSIYFFFPIHFEHLAIDNKANLVIFYI